MNGTMAYWPAELMDLGVGLREKAEAGEITWEQAKREADTLHALAGLGVSVAEEAPKVVDVDQPSEQFRIPERAVRQMEIGAEFTDPDGGTPVLPSPDDNRVGAFHAPASGAPVTERRAAVLAYPNTGTGRRKVLDAIAAAGERGMTDDEVAGETGMYRYSAAPRRNELLRDGWVEDSGRTRTNERGGQSEVWVLTDAGRSQWRPT